MANQADDKSKVYNDFGLQSASWASIAVCETRDKKYRFLGFFVLLVY